MAGWKRRAIGDLPVYEAKTLSWLPGVVQGFTTRRGGVSIMPYDSLNLGSHVGDKQEDVQANRERLWADLGFPSDHIVCAEQVHGDRIGHVSQACDQPMPGLDALITDTQGLLLMMLYADCVPIYLMDPLKRCIGLVHSGWRGTAANIAGKTVHALQETFAAVPGQCLAAIGPSIGMDSYEVGIDVADQFRNFAGGRNSGASTAVLPKDELGGKYLLNLRQVIFMQLMAAGLRADAIAVCDEDTFRNKREFYSFRRDGAVTGRMAAYLALQSEEAAKLR